MVQQFENVRQAYGEQRIEHAVHAPAFNKVGIQRASVQRGDLRQSVNCPLSLEFIPNLIGNVLCAGSG
jgi:hypothetical protein